ncbi:MAG: restriction endonuclease subunit S [Cyanobacteria bacterium P01_F01_bin.150]
MNNLPESAKYPQIAIGELASPEKGSFKIGPFGSSLKKEELVQFGIPVAGIENVLPNHFNAKFRKFITEDKFQQLSHYQLFPNDIVVTTMGTIGRAAVVPENARNMIMDSHLFRMRVDRKKVISSFLAYAINGFDGLKVQLKRKSRGAIMAGLNTTILKECIIPLPPLEEQRRIADIAMRADRLRRTRRYGQHLSDTYLQSVFLEMFGDPVTNSKGWKIDVLSNVIQGDMRNGLSPSNRGKFEGKVLTLSAITQKKFRGYEQKKATFDFYMPEDKRVKKTDLLICRGNGNIHLVGCGRFPDIDYPDVLFPDTVIAAPIDFSIVNREYVEVLWNSPLVRSQIEKQASTTNGTYKINQKVLSHIKLIVPPLPLQQKFAAIVQRFERLRRQQREGDRQAEHLFQSILHRAFRGEI